MSSTQTPNSALKHHLSDTGPETKEADKSSTLHREFTIDDENNTKVAREGTIFTGGDYSGAQKKTDPVEIKLVRKLDLWIMPTLWIMYWLNYLDRNAIALARLNDLEEDLGLSSSQYQTCVSIL